MRGKARRIELSRPAEVLSEPLRCRVRQRHPNGPASHRTSMIDAPAQPIRIGNR
jgi:hypothetical protein